MGLSARTDDQTGQPIGEGYVLFSTSAGNAKVFRSPAEAKIYLDANPGQFLKSASQTTPDGDFNQESQAPNES